MPVWTWEEIGACHARCYQTLEITRVEDLFNKYGGVPRFVMEAPSTHDATEDLDELISALSKTSINQVLMQLCS